LPPENVQFHVVGVPLNDWSLNVMVEPEHIVCASEKKSAIGVQVTGGLFNPVKLRLADVHKLFREATDEVRAARILDLCPAVNIREQ
jgi:hypothetical protein